MNKSLIIGVVAIAILATGAGLYSSRMNAENDAAVIEKEKVEKETMEKEAAMKAEVVKNDDAMVDTGEDKMVAKDDAAMMKTGSYETYNAEKIAKADSGDVVLFFRASWCPTCRTLDADIRAHLKNIPQNLTILDVDYDNSAALKKKYGVTYQHTLVQVDAQGNIVKKWSGSPTLSALVAEVK